MSTAPLFLGPSADGAAYRVPTKINALLREYQRTGVRFMFNGIAESVFPPRHRTRDHHHHLFLFFLPQRCTRARA